jgi:FixJ family two-component response regulator
MPRRKGLALCWPVLAASVYAILPIPLPGAAARYFPFTGLCNFESGRVKDEKFVVHVVDPDQAITDGLATLLNTYDIQVQSYPDAESFLQSWLPRRCRNCCLLAESDLPGLSGPALLRELRAQNVEIPVLLLVSTSAPDLIDVARTSSQVGVIEKPCMNHALIDHVLSLRGQD